MRKTEVVGSRSKMAASEPQVLNELLCSELSYLIFCRQLQLRTHASPRRGHASLERDTAWEVDRKSWHLRNLTMIQQSVSLSALQACNISRP
jgi:hypothetical protein